MQLAEITRHLEQIAPLSYAESWDNVGLLVGDPKQEIKRGILCIDYTPEVAKEAESNGCDLVIAYHPPIFKGLSKVVASGASALVFDAIRRGVAIYSPHTALDVADGGTNDVLADIVKLVDRQALRLSTPKQTEVKIVTFVPEKDVEVVANAIFKSGAGVIGDYSSCSFRTAGTGTFLGSEKSNPAVGQAGKFESVAEIKLESIAPINRLPTIVAALRAAHPYEEPAMDIVQLVSPPNGAGIGRIGRFDQPTDRQEIISALKNALNLDQLLIAGPNEGKASTAAICAGAGGDFLPDALAQNADIYITGELRHHDAIAAAREGMTVICTLHSNSERITLTKLSERLSSLMPQVQWKLSQADRDPFVIR